MDLLIIEGAGKIKKISQILGNNYKVIATVGHIEKLIDSGYDNTGISENLDFCFGYIDGKSKIMNDINSMGVKANNIYIATDPDREGEGIAYHIHKRLSKDNKLKAKRITFNEISEHAINEALKNTRDIDYDYVNAYLARIALDKKIGYGLSKFLQKSINLKSAGRVQSVVLKLVNDRTNEINNFKPKTYYYLKPIINECELTHSQSENNLNLFTNHDNYKFSFNNKLEAEDYINKYLLNSFKLIEIKEPRIKTTYPPSPYKTSTIQQELINQLKINSKKAEAILQKLYESGYISYPRTDSTRISEDFCKTAYEYVKNKYSSLASNEFRFNNAKSANGAQNAHECIRITHFDENLNDLDDQHQKAYHIIYDNTIIQFMKPIISEISEYVFKNNNDIFISNQEIVKQQGFNEYFNKSKNNCLLSFELNKDYLVNDKKDIIKSSTTSPPKPFTQSSLINKLEKLGIGRPSTYAKLVEINNIRDYTKTDKKDVICITESGKLATNSLNKFWSEIINYEFTSNMEDSLDKIADGKVNYKDYLKSFLIGFEQKLFDLMPKNSYCDYLCPKCNSKVLIKQLKDNKKLEICEKRKYDPKTKKYVGCDYFKFI